MADKTRGRISVVELGKLGLCLAAFFSRKGFQVVGVVIGGIVVALFMPIFKLPTMIH